MIGYYAVAALVIAFIASATIGRFLIPVLHKLNYGQPIKDIGPTWHKQKQGTPTMGGIMFVIAVLLSLLLILPVFSIQQKAKFPSAELAGLAMALIFTAMGIADDWIKIKHGKNDGLSALQKLAIQFIAAGGYLWVLYLTGVRTTHIPFLGEIAIGAWYYPVALIFIVGTVNAVNLTDGVDGLCGSVTFFNALFFMLGAALISLGQTSLLAAALAGAVLGFLIWNFYPAKVFMGDTGSMFLGGMVVALAFGINMPILLVPVGIIYYAEAGSVMLQVLYFKATHGKRLFKMSPIHHHYEMKGWSETKIVTIFCTVTILMAIGSLFLIVR